MEIYSTCVTGVEDLIIRVTFDDEHVCPTNPTWPHLFFEVTEMI